MAYATQADLTPSVIPGKVLVQLTDDAGTGQPDVSVVQDALDRASGIVETYCRSRYTLPLQATKELAGITVAIAAQQLYRRRSGTIPDGINSGAAEAMRMLRDIAAEKASLDQPIGSVDQTSSNPILKSTRHQRFSNRNLDAFS